MKEKSFFNLGIYFVISMGVQWLISTYIHDHYTWAMFYTLCAIPIWVVINAIGAGYICWGNGPWYTIKNLPYAFKTIWKELQRK